MSAPLQQEGLEEEENFSTTTTAVQRHRVSVSANSHHGEENDIVLTVLTFNLWGIFNSKIRLERMRHFASKVAHYDVLLLQEQFLEEDFLYIMSHLPPEVRESRYFKRFPSSFYGSGCAVISRFPIESAFFHTFPLQGYPEMVLHGDFFANKGVALTRILVPHPTTGALVAVRLYTTHLVAVYTKVSQLSDWRSERYLPYRISQAISIADFVATTSTPQDPIIIGGDFNSAPGSLEVQILLLLLKQRGYDMTPALPRPLPIPPPPSSLSEPQHSSAASSAQTQQRTTQYQNASGEGVPAPPTHTITWPERTTPSPLDRSHAFYTYADSNRYNTMSTSYFKLLKLQGDLPAQIDHIFFDAQHFCMENFDDCPDYEAPSIHRPNDTAHQHRPTAATGRPPSHQEASVAEGISPPSAPTAVVVLTNNEVPWPTGEQPVNRRGIGHRLMVFLSRLSRGRLSGGGGGNSGFDFVSMSCRDAVPGSGLEEVQPLFPISDHYGVAVRLRLKSNASPRQYHLACPASSSSFSPARRPLSDEELQVVESVREVLSMTAARLRLQQHYSRILCGFCGGVLLLSLYQVFRDRGRHRHLIRVSLRLVSQAVRYFNEGEEAREVINSLPKVLKKAGGMTGSFVRRGIEHTSSTVGGLVRRGAGAISSRLGVGRVDGSVPTPSIPSPSAVPPSSAHRSLIEELSLREVAESFVPPRSALYIAFLLITPVVGLTAFATGMLHRLSNAKLMEDQLRNVEAVVYGGSGTGLSGFPCPAVPLPGTITQEDDVE